MARHTGKLPLLHKYVFHNDDDLQLKMTKLQYRLCVQEVSSVILGRQTGLDLSDLEQTIVPDMSMATTVEAHPPMMEEFPADEGLSSPESEEYLHKPGTQNNQDYIYNDSGILMDESLMNNTQISEANGHLHDDDEEDDLSDTSSTTDPNMYHINRHNEEDVIEDVVGPCSTEEEVVEENGLEEVVEEMIEATEREREAHIPYDSLPPRTDDDTPRTDDDSDTINTDSMSDIRPTVSTTATPEDQDLTEVQEEVILRSEVKRKQLEATPEEELEEEKEDFVPGTTCEDVDTALRILKTRYRLSCSTLKKCIITFPNEEARNKRYSAPIFSYDRSRWNLQDVIRCPNEQMPWWSETREPESVVVKEDDRGVMNATIDRRQTEIADLLQKVLDEERKKREEEEEKNPTPVPISEPEVVACPQEPALEAIPEDEPQPITEDPTQPGKKKKGNLFQRMMRALRKRLSRNNRHRA